MRFRFKKTFLIIIVIIIMIIMKIMIMMIIMIMIIIIIIIIISISSWIDNKPQRTWYKCLVFKQINSTG